MGLPPKWMTMLKLCRVVNFNTHDPPATRMHQTRKPPYLSCVLFPIYSGVGEWIRKEGVIEDKEQQKTPPPNDGLHTVALPSTTQRKHVIGCCLFLHQVTAGQEDHQDPDECTSIGRFHGGTLEPKRPRRHRALDAHDARVAQRNFMQRTCYSSEEQCRGISLTTWVIPRGRCLRLGPHKNSVAYWTRSLSYRTKWCRPPDAKAPHGSRPRMPCTHSGNKTCATATSLAAAPITYPGASRNIGGTSPYHPR